MAAGLAAQWSSTVFSAAAPVTAEPNTSSPALTPSTSAPTSSTTPAASSPGMLGSATGIALRDEPPRIFQSTGLIPAARTRIRI
jgi:hypothetical protein